MFFRKKKSNIKVGKRIKPLPPDMRTEIPLVIGQEYFVCFGRNLAQRCILTSILDIKGEKGICVKIPKPPKRKMIAGNNENESPEWLSTHYLFRNEIGLTPEQAVLHQVVF